MTQPPARSKNRHLVRIQLTYENLLIANCKLSVTEAIQNFPLQISRKTALCPKCLDFWEPTTNLCSRAFWFLLQALLICILTCLGTDVRIHEWVRAVAYFCPRTNPLNFEQYFSNHSCNLTSVTLGYHSFWTRLWVFRGWIQRIKLELRVDTRDIIISRFGLKEIKIFIRRHYKSFTSYVHSLM